MGRAGSASRLGVARPRSVGACGHPTPTPVVAAPGACGRRTLARVGTATWRMGAPRPGACGHRPWRTPATRWARDPVTTGCRCIERRVSAAGRRHRPALTHDAHAHGRHRPSGHLLAPTTNSYVRAELV